LCCGENLVMETVIGILIWIGIFLTWYVKNYPDKFGKGFSGVIAKYWGKRKPSQGSSGINAARNDQFGTLVKSVEKLCSKDTMGSSDAALLVDSINKLIKIEQASGQIWEAYALDCLETATIACDDCMIPVEKTVKKTGIKIQCKRCGKWLALRNSKVTVIDHSRSDLEHWEK
jgi:hypothetical protein